MTKDYRHRNGLLYRAIIVQCSAPDRDSHAALELLIDLLYTLSGTCKYGAACRYAHVDATKTGAKTSRKVRPGRDSGLSPMDVSTGVGANLLAMARPVGRSRSAALAPRGASDPTTIERRLPVPGALLSVDVELSLYM